MLANSYRRRFVLTLLAHTPEDETHNLSMMADDAEEFEELYLKLYHQHLPKLEEANVIEWDRDENVVRKGPAFEELVPLLRLHPRPSGRTAHRVALSAKLVAVQHYRRIMTG